MAIEIKPPSNRPSNKSDAHKTGRRPVKGTHVSGNSKWHRRMVASGMTDAVPVKSPHVGRFFENPVGCNGIRGAKKKAVVRAITSKARRAEACEKNRRANLKASLGR